MKKIDDRLLENITEAVKQANVSAEIKILSATDVFANGQIDNDYIKQIMPIAQKYGTAVAPIVFINGKLKLYGGVPSIEKIVKTLNDAQ